MKTRLALLALVLPAAALASTVTVMVQETTLRKRPQFFAPVAATAKLGQTFDASGPESGWYKTEDGYLHESAVSSKKVKLSAGGAVGSAATAEEVTLAGKGFNAQVEKSYKGKNASADFSAVDAMERRSVSETTVLEFLRAGGVQPAGGSR